MFSGYYLRGEQLLESLPVHRELTEATYDAILVHTYLSGIFEGQGKFPQSIEHGDEGIRLAEARGTPQLLANAILFSAMSASAQGDFARAIGLAERILALCRKWNLTMMSASAKAMLGQAYALSGRVAEGVPMLEEGVTAMATMRHGGGIALFQLYLGQAYLAAGRIADASAVGEKALAVAREGGQRGIEGRAHCFLGEIALHQDRHDQAERCFLDALALAEACGSPPLAAHCHFGYATLYRSAGAERQARDHLATATAMYRAMGMTYWLERVEGT